MVLWRVSRHRDLSGTGGLRHSARWHDRGRPVVYLAESPAGALLETCVHLSAGDVPPVYILLDVLVDDRVAVEELDTAALPADWADRTDITRAIGTAWLRSHRGALLRVPSALVPRTWNVLLNPMHPDFAGLKIGFSEEYPFDRRIKV